MKFEDEYKIVYVSTDKKFNIPHYNDEYIQTYKNRRYYKGYLVHREDGPALEGLRGDRVKSWYINGKHHREDGPAIERPDRNKYYYYLNNIHYSENEYWSIINSKKKQEILESIL